MLTTVYIVSVIDWRLRFCYILRSKNISRFTWSLQSRPAFYRTFFYSQSFFRFKSFL